MSASRLVVLGASGLLGRSVAVAAARAESRNFRRVIWSGLTTYALAEILVSLVEQREVSGLLHIAGEPIDKYRLLCLAAEIFGKTDVDIEPVDEPVCDRSLRSDRLSTLGIPVPSIRAMLEGLRDREIRHAEVV